MNKPEEILDIITTAASGKNSKPPHKFFASAIMGGAFISLGSIFAVKVAANLPGLTSSNPGLVSLLFGLLFPLGFLLVTLTGTELFTSTIAVTSIGLCKKQYKPLSLGKIWGLSYFGNFTGALITALVLGLGTHVLGSETTSSYLEHIAVKKTSAGFLTVMVKGIGANWLVCLAAIAGYAAKNTAGKILAIWLPVAAFVAMGFEHSVANMFFIPMSMMQGSEISVGTFIVKNLIPATLGNIIGGVGFAGLPFLFIHNHKSASK
jgi:formate/nitrite transporter